MTSLRRWPSRTAERQTKTVEMEKGEKVLEVRGAVSGWMVIKRIRHSKNSPKESVCVFVC